MLYFFLTCYVFINDALLVVLQLSDLLLLEGYERVNLRSLLIEIGGDSLLLGERRYSCKHIIYTFNVKIELCANNSCIY